MKRRKGKRRELTKIERMEALLRISEILRVNLPGKSLDAKIKLDRLTA